MLFIDVSKAFTPGKTQNVMDEAHIAKVLDICRRRAEIDTFSHLASPQDIADEYSRAVEAKWSGAMKNMMEINGYRAVIQFDPDIDMFRGEFVGLNGGADFYARDIASLKAEGEASLKVFLAMCQEDGVEPGKQYSGKFNVRISLELHATIAAAAAADGKSLNQWITDELRHAVAE